MIRYFDLADNVATATESINAGIGVTMCESAEEFFAQLDSDDDA
jgi:hypothetical protein